MLGKACWICGMQSMCQVLWGMAQRIVICIPEGRMQRPVKIPYRDDTHALSTEASSNVNHPAGIFGYEATARGSTIESLSCECICIVLGVPGTDFSMHAWSRQS